MRYSAQFAYQCRRSSWQPAPAPLPPAPCRPCPRRKGACHGGLQCCGWFLRDPVSWSGYSRESKNVVECGRLARARSGFGGTLACGSRTGLPCFHAGARAGAIRTSERRNPITHGVPAACLFSFFAFCSPAVLRWSSLPMAWRTHGQGRWVCSECGMVRICWGALAVPCSPDD